MKKDIKKISAASLAAVLTATMLFSSACTGNSSDTDSAKDTVTNSVTESSDSADVNSDTNAVETDGKTDAEETKAPEESVTTGYELSDGTLTVLDDSAMADHAEEKQVPWYEQRESIKSIVISDGVTKIGKYAFFECSM